MRVLVLTSCTGAKAVAHPRALTPWDFSQGPRHVARRERELAGSLKPAEVLYTGQQHQRLLDGVKALRSAGRQVDVYILSAGYGIVPGARPLAPYNCTFTGMPAPAVREWADRLGVPGAFRRLLARKHDLAIVLLGEVYLSSCRLSADLRVRGSLLLLCSHGTARELPPIERCRAIALGTAEARRFHCGLVGLKGEIARRLLTLIAQRPDVAKQAAQPGVDVLALLDPSQPAPARPVLANPRANRAVSIAPGWWQRSGKRPLSYFIPDWDDLVDPDYDFLADQHSHGRGSWCNQVYAHQLYRAPNYDGLLVSRLVAEERAEKRARINALGVHGYFRVPARFPIMGDCGAFGYIDQEAPPYQTGEILDYYTRLRFDYGVSIDHLIVSAAEATRRRRYELTIENAATFLKEHRKQGLTWTPIGAVQGWDEASYAAAARQYVKMGYRYIALGGLVRSQTPEILRIVAAVRAVLPEGLRLHLFGLGRLAAMHDFARLGVTSIDSASPLRRAWSGSTLNFLTATGWYSAIRIPQSDGCFPARRLVQSGERTAAELRRLERQCLGGVRAWAAGRKTPPAGLVDRLTEYDELLAGQRPGTRERIRRTLVDRPWEACGCAICARWGAEVAIFRGNNRNRRRGFHNTYVFYQLLGRLLDGERIAWITREPAPEANGRPS